MVCIWRGRVLRSRRWVNARGQKEYERTAAGGNTRPSTVILSAVNKVIRARTRPHMRKSRQKVAMARAICARLASREMPAPSRTALRQETMF